MTTTNQVRPSTNPSGGRNESPLHDRARERVERARADGGLPHETSPYQLLDTLHQIGDADGWSPHLIATLRQLMLPIPDADWRSGRPVNFRPMKELATDLHISPRTLRDRLNRLLELGALSFEDDANYHRGRKRGKAYGVDLAPCILLAAEAKALAAAIARERRYLDELRRTASTVRRRIANILKTPPQRTALGRHLKPIKRDLEEIFPGRLDRLLAKHLEALVTALTRLLERCLRLLDPSQSAQEQGVDKAVDNTLIQLHGDKDRFRHCGSAPPPPITSTTTAVSPDGCSASRNGRNGHPRPPSVAQLVEALPPDIALELPIERRLAGTVTPEDLIGVCRRHRPRLGIAHHAWTKAESTIGAFQSAIVLIIAAARSAPDWPSNNRVRSPGGFFTEVTRRVDQGTADLRSAIHGIVARRLAPRANQTS